MTSHYLIVDSFRYSTGIRDEFTGEYLALDTLPLNAAVRDHLTSWVQRYQQAQVWHDKVGAEATLHALDAEGLQLAKELKTMLGSAVKIKYYSDAFGSSFLT